MVFSKFWQFGDKTENGKVFEAAQIDDSVHTPLNEQLDGLADLITKLSYIFAALIIVLVELMVFFNLESYCFDIGGSYSYILLDGY